MDNKFAIILGFMVLSLTASVASVEGQDQDVLDNGLVRIVFNHRTGQFEALPLTSGGLRLYDAGPSFQKDSRKISARDATRVEAGRENFEDPVGRGERLVINYAYGSGDPSLRYELNLYSGRPWASATAYLERGDYRLGDVAPVEGKVSVRSAFKARVYVNQGSAGGDSGVWEMGVRSWSSANLSVWYEPMVEEALALGFFSFYRASSSVNSQYLAPNEIGVSAVAHYNGYRPKDGELRSESVLMDFGHDPLVMLEEWADAAVKVVRPQFLHDVHTSLLNTWYVYGDKISEADTLEQAKLLQKSILNGYGVKVFGVGEWQVQRFGPGDLADHFGFGEDQEDKGLFPHGVKWLSEQLQDLGFQVAFGANYAYAAPESTIAKKHVPWIVWNDYSRPDFGYPIDFTHPDAQKWLYDLAHRTTEYKAAVWWDDFDGGPHQGVLHDSTKIMGFEDIREGIKTIRRAVGPDVLIHRFCCGPYFTYVGLADRVRVGDDTHALGDFEGLKAMARQLASNFMLHQRFWINDPDPVWVGGRDSVHDPGTGPLGPDRSTIAEVRMRLQHEVATGGFITVGENLADMDSERLRLLTLVLPSMGQAARPLDLFLHTPPEVYDLKVKTSWDEWHVVMLQNWNDRDKSYQIGFAQLGLEERRSYLVYRFWDQTFLGEHRGKVDLKVGARDGESYVIREAPSHPWVLSTDLHLTQGGVDLPEVEWQEGEKKLSGVAARHLGAEGHVVVYVPNGYRESSASGPYQEEREPSGAAVIHLQVQFQNSTMPWSLTFSGPQ
jgi:hypothetical protein